MPDLELIAATAFGLEAVVARELQALGYEPTIIATGRVLFRGDESAICRANTWLRTADRVLIRLGSFPAADFDELFEGVRALPWERWIGPEAACPMNGRSVKSQLSSVPACQKIAKKALVERLKAAHGVETLPETGPRVSCEVALLDNVATLTIDTSGDGLHKRGYRQLIGDAQLKETLAAGLVLLSVWRPERPLVDPFCGSGTIPIEAAMIGRNLAPGLFRTFDAVDWGVIADEHWDKAEEEARDLATGKLAYPVHGFDIAEDQLSLARHHAKRAGVQDSVQFNVRDFRDLSSRLEFGCTIMNPPYGDRIGRGRDIYDLYQAFPDVLRRLPTWSHHILTSWDDFETIVGQPATRRRKLFNAQIECTYYQFLGPRPPGAPPVQAESKPIAGAFSPAAVAAAQPAPDALEGEDLDTEAQDIEARTAEALGETDEQPVETPETPVPEPIPVVDDVTAPRSFGGLRERDVREIDDFGRRLEKNWRHLRKYPARGITCYRVYERDVPDVPVIIDRYEDALHIAEYQREHSRTFAQHADWLDAVAARAAEVCGIDRRRVFVKRKHRQTGPMQHQRLGDKGVTSIVSEAGHKFEVNLSDYVDTGLFLDHRLTRGMVREESGAARFLNLFCYTGSFTVYAACEGAASTTSVDLSNTYLAWAGRNLELNGQPWTSADGRAGAPPIPGTNRLIRADVMEWLRSHPKGEHYDLAVVDPPTFSNSKRLEGVFDVERDHLEMLTLLRGLLAPGATVYFSNNFRRFHLNETGLAAAGYQFREISRRTVPPEYRNQRIHRCWKLRPRDENTPASGGAGVEPEPDLG